MTVEVLDLGVVGFEEADRFQRELLIQIRQGERPSTLLLLEHPPTLTLGASFQPQNLLHPRSFYEAGGIRVIPTDRGGDVTYHGPGQLVAYPVFDLQDLGKDLHRWLRGLEETSIQLLSGYGIEGRRFAPHTGVWVGGEKVTAIGIKVSRWVSFHGMAVNCDNDLAPFSEIVPCGIHGYGVTSLSAVTGTRIGVEDVKPRLIQAFQSVFDLTVASVEPWHLSSMSPTPAV